MSAFNLLRPSHLMIGVDPHDAIMPPEPAKVPFIPHVCTAWLRGGMHVSAPGFAGTVYHTPSVKVCFDDALQRSTDIGVLIGHIQYNLLLPIVIADSKSKSMFGASTVRAEGRPVATAIFNTFNLNLNCGEPVRQFSGFVEAPCTVRAGMTQGDLAAGLAEAAFDMAFGLVKSEAFKALIKVGLGRILSQASQKWLKDNKAYNDFLEKAIKLGMNKATEGVKVPPTIWDRLPEQFDDPKHRVFL